ncbi:APC family permease [Acidihalobacter ferrooxydans]|uniref:APC family permease n=1 Tax=Acidihalobacter ferrooxydans TaxID=1765967 RepID=UPI0018DB5E0A|nr:APC family permease [Acidihalobacter ferrooxydans]
MAKTCPPKTPLGTGALLSIGVGGMIGGGIFAVTGLTIELTRGAAPIAFAIAGVVALLTAWSYLKLTLRYPSSGGTVEYLNRAFGPGVLTGALNILLCLSYVILLAIYAYAFGSYGAQLFDGGPLARHLLASGILITLAVLNFLGPHLVIRSENSFNILKLILLVGFIVAGLTLPGEPARLAPAHWVAPLPLLAGAMIIFLNYEGFELIANAAPQATNPRRSLPVAYLGGVAIVLLMYMGIAAAVLLHLGFGAVAAHRDDVLSAAAQQLLGHGGAVAVIIAALAATASAINATFYGSGRLTYLIAKYGELPAEFEHNIRNQPVE